MSKKSRVEALATGKTPRYAIYDLQSGKPYVMVVYPDFLSACESMRDLLKPYRDDDPWRHRLVVRCTEGCGVRGPKGQKCNLAEGHSAPHAEVIWYDDRGGRQATIWFEKKSESDPPLGWSDGEDREAERARAERSKK